MREIFGFLAEELYEKALYGLGIRYDQPVGFEQGPEPENDPPRTQFDIAGIPVVVQKEQVMDFHAALADDEFWRTDSAECPSFAQTIRLTDQGIDLPETLANIEAVFLPFHSMYKDNH